jgi:hypothetical protein
LCFLEHFLWDFDEDDEDDDLDDLDEWQEFCLDEASESLHGSS